MPKVNYSTFSGLSPKQRLWLIAYFDSSNPATFMNLTGAAKAAGYRGKNDKSFDAIGRQNFGKLRKFIRERMDKLGLSDIVLDSLMIQGMNATENKVFHHTDKDGNSEIIYSKPLINWSARRAFLDMANKIRGRYATEKIQIEDDSELHSVPLPVLKELAEAILAGQDDDE